MGFAQGWAWCRFGQEGSRVGVEWVGGRCKATFVGLTRRDEGCSSFDKFRGDNVEESGDCEQAIDPANVSSLRTECDRKDN